MKKWRKILPSVVVISLLLLLGCVSVDAQGNNDYDEGVWTDQCKLNISKHQIDETFSANGVDKAKMDIMIEDKKTNNPVIAQSDIEVWLSSKNGIVKPREITISKGNAKSEAISLTSTQPGIASVIAEAAGFEAATTSVEFTPPLRPCELYLTAHPNKNITANGKDQTKLTVKLLKAEGELFIPQANEYVDIATNRGETLRQINISKNKPYGEANFTTRKAGPVEFIAKSLVFGLEGRTEATFVSPIKLLTIALALLGGLVGGFVEYCSEHKKEFIPLATHKSDGTWELGMIGYSIPHALLGLIVYMGTCLGMHLIPVELPIDVWYSVFIIGFIGGFSSFDIISSLRVKKPIGVLGFIYKKLKKGK